MSESKDTKPDTKPAPMNIKVKDSSGSELTFKVKASTKFSKIFEAYATRKGIVASALRFTFDGERIDKAETPASMDMEDGDTIDAVMEQQGGGRAGSL